MPSRQEGVVGSSFQLTCVHCTFHGSGPGVQISYGKIDACIWLMHLSCSRMPEDILHPCSSGCDAAWLLTQRPCPGVCGEIAALCLSFAGTPTWRSSWRSRWWRGERTCGCRWSRTGTRWWRAARTTGCRWTAAAAAAKPPPWGTRRADPPSTKREWKVGEGTGLWHAGHSGEGALPVHAETRDTFWTWQNQGICSAVFVRPGCVFNGNTITAPCSCLSAPKLTIRTVKSCYCWCLWSYLLFLTPGMLDFCLWFPLGTILVNSQGFGILITDLCCSRAIGNSKKTPYLFKIVLII